MAKITVSVFHLLGEDLRETAHNQIMANNVSGWVWQHCGATRPNAPLMEEIMQGGSKSRVGPFRFILEREDGSTTLVLCSRGAACSFGILIDVTSAAKELGCDDRVAFSRAAFEFLSGEPVGGPDVRVVGRTRDVLVHAVKAIRQLRAWEPGMPVVVLLEDHELRLLGLREPDLDGTPMLTIGLPEEYGPPTEGTC
jgi:hypothetical protein